MKPTLVVLAAGMGSRYGGLKQMDTVGPSGETIVDYVIYDAIQAGFAKIVFVIRKDIEEEFRKSFYANISQKVKVEYVFQDMDDLPNNLEVPDGRIKPWGTAHAVWMARNVVKEPFAIVNADDFYGRDSLKSIFEHLNELDNSILNGCLVGYVLRNTLSEHGKVSRGICEINERKSLLRITERTDIYQENNQCFFVENNERFPLKGDETVSMNLIGFTSPVFEIIESGLMEFYHSATDIKQEYYIPTVLDKMKSSGKEIPVIPSIDKWFGVTYKEDKAIVEKKIQELVADGTYPSNLWE